MTTNRIRRNGILVAPLMLVVAAAGSASAEVGPQPPKPDRLWVSLLAQSPVKNMMDYAHRWEVYVPREIVGTPPPEI